MKKFFTLLLRWIIRIAVVMIVLAAVILGALRAVLTYSEHFRPQLTHWVSEALDQPVKISKVTASWYGFEPILSFSDVILYNKDKTKPMVVLRQLSVGINLLTSLLHFKVEPGHLVLSGAHLNVYQEKNGSYTVEGIEKLSRTAQLAQTVRSHSNDFIASVLDFLKHKDQFTLENFSLTLHANNGRTYNVSKFGFSIENSLFGYRLFGVALLQQSKRQPAYLRFVIHFLDVGAGSLEQVSADGYISAYHLAVADLPETLHLHGWRLDHGVVNAQIWGKWQRQKLQHLQALVDAKNLQLTAVKTHEPMAFKQLSGNFFFKARAHSWALSADKINIVQQDHTWPFSQFSIEMQQAHAEQPLSESVRFSFLHLADMRRWLLGTHWVPKTLRQALAGLNPRGALYNVDIKRITFKGKPAQYQAQAQFRNLSINRWRKIPGFTNFNGSFNFDSTAGRAEIIGLDSEVDLRPLFRTQLPLTKLNATVSWLHKNGSWRIDVNDFSGLNSTLSVTAKMGLDLPAKGVGKIDLIGGFNVFDMRQASRFFPTKIMSAKLVTWLDQVAQGGQASAGTILVRGPLAGFPYEAHQGIFKISNKLDNINFHYAPGWPNLHHLYGQLTFEGNSMRAKIDSAKVFNSTTITGNVVIPVLTHALVKITTNVDAPLETASQFIAASPLKNNLGRNLGVMKPSGPMHLDLNIAIPIYQTQQPDTIKGMIAMANAHVVLADSPLVITQLNGKIFFTQDSVTANNLLGQLFGHPININVLTLAKTTSPMIEIEAGGQFNVATLAQQLKLPLTDYMSGRSNYRALLQIPYLQKSQKILPNQLNIISDLSGVAVKLPEPLTKNAQDAHLSQLQFTLYPDKPIQLDFNYGDNVSGALAFNRIATGYQFDSGELHFGKGRAVQQRQPGLLISGSLPTINIAPWQAFFDKVRTTTQTAKTTPKVKKNKTIVREINFKLQHLTLFEQKLAPLRIIAIPLRTFWQVTLLSPAITGQLQIPNDYPAGILQANFKRLFLNFKSNAPKQKTPAATTVAQTFKNFNLNDVPSLNLAAADFRFNQKPFGTVNLRLRQKDGILQIDHFTSTTNNYSLALTGFSAESGKTTEGTTVAKTDVNGSITVKDLGGMLADYKMTDIVKEGKGRVKFALRWLGTIISPNLATMEGALNLNLSNGRIVHLSQKAQADIGIGRVLSLLSLQSLPSRLFHIGNLGKKGFYFSDLSGEFIFNKGAIFTHNGELKGPVAKVLVRGRIGLVHEDYDLTLQVRPYITSSVPIIATIVGGPIVGGITWVANKILTPEIGKLAGSTYVVTGPWSQPKVDKVKTLKSEHLDLPLPHMLTIDQGVQVEHRT